MGYGIFYYKEKGVCSYLHKSFQTAEEAKNYAESLIEPLEYKAYRIIDLNSGLKTIFKTSGYPSTGL